MIEALNLVPFWVAGDMPQPGVKCHTKFVEKLSTHLRMIDHEYHENRQEF